MEAVLFWLALYFMAGTALTALITFSLVLGGVIRSPQQVQVWSLLGFLLVWPACLLIALAGFVGAVLRYAVSEEKNE